MSEARVEEPAQNGSVHPATLIPLSAEQFEAMRANALPKRSKGRGAAFWAPVTALALLLIAGLLFGAFMFGQGTRMSDDAVSAKVTGKHRVDARHEAAALAGQKTLLSQRFKAQVKRLNKLSFQKGRRQGEASGYASGQSAGYSAGQSQGVEQGKQQGRDEGYQDGFNEGTCFTPGTLNYVC